jgi:4-diphosphocytidyl-2-C-methyl-D-erythritol kinase
VNSVTEFSPAKLNLFLAVTGQRADAYHDLVSVVAPLDYGDDLEARSEEREARSRFSLECDTPGVPTDGTNLILKAANAFAAATGWQDGVSFKLTKRIPVGAGLGGGSSNAVAALRALNRLSGGALGEAKLAEMAGALGSDCPLFLRNEPVIMRGRGERIEPLPATAAARVRGRRVLLFKPGFGISTAWAYGRMASSSAKAGADQEETYWPVAQAEARLAAWLGGNAPVEELLANNMEGVAFEKFIALPVLLAKLRRESGIAARMSGSGSACFAVLPDDFAAAPLIASIRAAWGPPVFVQEARLA